MLKISEFGTKIWLNDTGQQYFRRDGPVRIDYNGNVLWAYWNKGL